MMKPFRYTFCILIAIAIFAAALPAVRAADDVDDLRDKIDQTQEQIDKLNAEIAQLERDLQKVGADRSTLEKAIKELNLTRQKLLSDITLTQKKIEKAGYNIEQLGLAIDDKEAKIERNISIIAGALRTIQVADDRTFVETVLSYDSLSELWIEIDQLETVQDTVKDQLRELKGLKTELETQEATQRKERESLNAFKKKLTGQKQVIEENKKTKDNLLATTKSTEAAYQAQLAQKQLARQQMESALQEYEAKLQYTLDPSRLPTKGSGALGWPVELRRR